MRSLAIILRYLEILLHSLAIILRSFEILLNEIIVFRGNEIHFLRERNTYLEVTE